MADGLTIERDGARVTVAGELRTVADCELLKAAVDTALELINAHRPEIVIDVADTRYLDARALASLVTIARKCINVGVTLVLEHASEELVALLRMTKMDQVLRLRGARVGGAT